MNRCWIAGWTVSACLAGGAGEAGEPEPGRLRREDYQGLFPFYSRERFEGGGSRVSAAFHLFRSQEEPDGGGYRHLLPFYFAAREAGGAARSLAVFPSFAFWERGETSHLLLWPLFQTAREPGSLPFCAIPTLFRHGRFGDEERERLGVPVLAELFERSVAPGRTAYTFLNLFNFGEETRHGLPLGKLSRWGDRGYHAHLVPLLLAGRDGDSRYLHTPLYGRWSSGSEDLRGWVAPLLLSGRVRRGESTDLYAPWPLVHLGSSPTESSVRAAPFYFAGEHRAGDGEVLSRHRFVIPLLGATEEVTASRRDLYLPFLLSRFGEGKEERAVDVVWPLGHYSEGPGRFALRALPFFDRARDGDGGSLGVGAILYRRHQDTARKTVAHWAPLPLVHWKRSPEGLVAWGVPALYHRDETVGRTRTITTAVAPGFIHRVARTSIPDGGGERETRSVHAPWPFVRWSSEDGSRAFRIAPLVFDWRSDAHGTTVTGPLAWFRYRSSAERHWFHLLPLAFGERQGDHSGLGVFPFYYRRQWGAEAIRPWTAGRFFFLWNTLVGGGEEHRSLLWKAMETTREADGDFEFRLFHRLVVNRKVDGQREVVVNPFFRFLTDARTGARRLSILKFLYTSELKAGVKTRRLFLLKITRDSA